MMAQQSGFAIRTTLFALFNFLLFAAFLATVFYLLYLSIRALKKYIGSSQDRQEKSRIKRSLGEAIKQNRNRCGMTQEFVAEALGVSRQAVSKWERGDSDPSTANLLALAKLFGISAEEMLRDIS